MQRANRWAECQWTCFGYSSSREPPNEPKFFLELLTTYTHVFNTEARIFDHFLNFPNRANAQWHYCTEMTCFANFEAAFGVASNKWNSLQNSGLQTVVLFSATWYIKALFPLCTYEGGEKREGCMVKTFWESEWHNEVLHVVDELI